MDPPDVLGVDSSTARPTKLPNRAKSTFSRFAYCDDAEKVSLFVSECEKLKGSRLSSTEQPPPRPPQPAILLKSELLSSLLSVMFAGRLLQCSDSRCFVHQQSRYTTW